jgi:lipopolysaccharide biosynthesis glycosyltransferase
VTPPPIELWAYDKFRIMSLANLSEYDKVLYLDNDIIVTGDLNPMFDVIDKPNVLYTAAVPDMSEHQKEWYSNQMLPYSGSVLDHFTKNNIFPFCVGHFGFIPSKKMKDHFDEIYELRKNSMISQEQIAINSHFCTRNLLDYSLTKFIYLQPTWEDDVQFNRSLVTHFVGMFSPAKIKLNLMKKYFIQFVLNDMRHAVCNDPIVSKYEMFNGTLDLPRGWVMFENTVIDDNFLFSIAELGLRIWWTNPDRSKFLIRI